MNDTTQHYVANQLVTTFYACKTLRFIAAELSDNTNTQFQFEHLFSQLELINHALQDIMNEVIE